MPAYWLPALLTLLIAPAASAKPDPLADRDWISVDTLSRDNLCYGYYQGPDLPEAAGGEEAPIEIEADHSEVFLDGRSELSGGVFIRQGSQQIEAETAEIIHDDKGIASVAIGGEVVYNQPGFQVLGRSADLDRDTQTLTTHDVTYHLYNRHARGHADSLAINSDKVATLSNATYSACPPYDNTWQLDSKTTVLDIPEGRGSTWHTWVKIHNVPILYLPYLNFAIDKKRKTGFLYPSWGNSSNSGSMVEFPFYWNIAPNYDFLLTARWLELRGTQWEGFFRYLNAHSEGHVDYRILPMDERYEKFRHIRRRNHPTISDSGDPRLLGLTGTHRTYFALKHKTHFNHRWAAQLDYTSVSDDNYFVDLDDDLYSASIAELPQELKVTYDSTHWHNLLRLQETQVLRPFDGPSRDESYRRQPQLTLSAEYPAILPHFGSNLSVEAVNFARRRNPLTKLSSTRGERYHIRPSIYFPYRSAGWYLTPRMQVDMTNYYLTLATQDEDKNRPRNPSRVVPMYDVSGGLFFDKHLNWKGTSYLHTIEPKLYYLFVPYRLQDPYPIFDTGPTDLGLHYMYRDNRFSGLDRIGDANRLTLGLTSRLLQREQGWERGRVTLGQVFYFGNRRVTLCDSTINPACRLNEDPSADDSQSAFASDWHLALTDRFSTDGNIEVASDFSEIERAGLNLAYRSSSAAVLNVNYQYLKFDPAKTNLTTGAKTGLEQVAASFYWPVSPRWSALGRWNYDQVENHLIDTMLGMEYNTCCMAFQLMGSRFFRPANAETQQLSSAVTGQRKYNTAVHFRIMLKGLSSFGYHHSDAKMQRLIPGYRSFKERDFT